MFLWTTTIMASGEATKIEVFGHLNDVNFVRAKCCAEVCEFVLFKYKIRIILFAH